ncbi:hypothetical protein [Sphingobium phenoxybenzoativorans]|uniref:hypothetical protein n=1 Tax=Sphingobium phenoxybenzoativorans TaxID=1592790 RepID=UPI0008724E44|nr:hypothetical protein [Sphingobium phenoxybenzoativorans]
MSYSGEAEATRGDTLFKGCLILLALLLCLPLGFCTLIQWRVPRQALPPEIQWSEIIGFDGEAGFREGCSFGVYRITPATVARFRRGNDLPLEWYRTPLRIEDGQYAYVGPDQRRITLYANNASNCASEKLQWLRLNDHRHVLGQSGNWHKIFNGGEGMILIAPDEGLAWYMYAG